MDREISSIIEAVRSREERRRRTALSINAALLVATIAPLCALFLYYPLWLLILWIPPLVVAAIFISRSEYQSIQVSHEEASEILDATLKTKERVRTFTLISQSSAAPDLVRSAFIAEQIREYIPPSFTPESILELNLTKAQKWALVAALVGIVLSAALFLLRPLSPLERVAQSLQTIVNAHPELPKGVAIAAQQSIESLSGSDLATAQESLQRTQDEIAKALESQTKTTEGERTIEGAALSPLAKKEQPSIQRKPSPPPAAQQPQTKRNETSDEKNEKKDSSNQDGDNDKEQNKEKQPSEDSKEKSEEGASEENNKSENQEQEGKSAQEKESKDDGKSQEGQSNKSQDGEGQGSGQGAGSSGSGSGDQGENQDQSSQSQGQSGAAQQGQGQGEGSAQDSQGGPQSQGGSAKEGEQKEGSPSGSSGLEQLQKAVDQASQEVQKERQQQDADQAGKQGDQGKGEGNKASSSGKEQESKGEQGNKEVQKQQRGQQGKGDSKSSASNKKESSQDQKGKGEQGSQSKSDSQKNDPQKNEQGNTGKTGEASKQAQPEKEKEDQESGESEADGAGDKSSMPDRSAKAKEEAPPSEGEGSDLSALPPPVKESQIGNDQEQLDARFTGGDATLEENKKPAQAKTTLDDVILAKPQGSTHKGSQPIPLEYRDILAGP